jgi:hypothetical protein
MGEVLGHTKVGRLNGEDARRLDDDGFVLLRGVIPTGGRPALTQMAGPAWQ